MTPFPGQQPISSVKSFRVGTVGGLAVQIEIVREAIGMAVFARLHGSCIRGTPGVPLTFNWTLNADKIKVFMPLNH